MLDFLLCMCQQQWLDLNPQPWDDELSVLPLCCPNWAHLSVVYSLIMSLLMAGVFAAFNINIWPVTVIIIYP